MDELLKKLQACSRFLRLEETLSDLESQAAEEKYRIQERMETICRKESELASQEATGFLHLLFGKSKGKKEKLEQQLMELKAALEDSEKDLEILERKKQKAKEEWSALQDSRDVYQQAKQETQLTAGQESRLMMEELAAFAPPALAMARKTQNSLETALTLGKDASQVQRTLLLEAAQNAGELKKLLDMLPEGFAEISGYLQNPKGWSSKPELALAVSQLQNLTNQLRAILGE